LYSEFGAVPLQIAKMRSRGARVIRYAEILTYKFYSQKNYTTIGINTILLIFNLHSSLLLSSLIPGPGHLLMAHSSLFFFKTLTHSDGLLYIEYNC
jgi:hypothetical protein